MTYAEVLDDIFDLFNRHRMIQTWGYGNLSDIVEPLLKDPATYPQDTGRFPTSQREIDYPYAFLNPTNHTLQKGSSVFRFNLIMMEACDDNIQTVIKAQSECHQYIKDVLAELYYNYDQKYDFTLNVNVVPFKEKYNDTVSGMTASIELSIIDPIDDCIAPFAPKGD